MDMSFPQTLDELQEFNWNDETHTSTKCAFVNQNNNTDDNGTDVCNQTPFNPTSDESMHMVLQFDASGRGG